MKTIGLLGGTSWPSTIDYYDVINRMVGERLGGYHSAQILLKSIDYHDIKSRYWTAWNEIPPLLQKHLADLIALKPDVMLICNNTLHNAFDSIAKNLDFSHTQFVHIVEETGKEIAARGYNNVLLLGTKLTMENGYYDGKLKRDFQLNVATPNEEHRNEIQKMQTAISLGEKPSGFAEGFQQVLTSYGQYDAIVLACTELPLVITPAITDIPIINPTYLQCRRAVELALI